jgi:hypothetical protein
MVMVRVVKLSNGWTIACPSNLIRAFVEHWYDMYDGVQVVQDNELRAEEVALSTMLMSRISGLTAGYLVRIKESIEDGLSKIGPDCDLLDVGAGEVIPGTEGMSQAVTAMCAVPRAKLGVSTKILHKKRPGLIPVLDSFVANH